MLAPLLEHHARPAEITLKSVFVSFDYGFTQKLIRAIALVGVFGQVAFYFLCSRTFGMRESLALRLLSSALLAGAVLLPTGRPLRRREKLYWEVTANDAAAVDGADGARFIVVLPTDAATSAGRPPAGT
jgi:hypothetical protein